MSAALDPLAWVAEQVERAELEVTPIALADSEQWRWHEGAIVHRSGRFFRVIGHRDADGVAAQPLIDQREVGTLCGIHRPALRPELLVQAKAEPGTVGVVQLAPSIQATASNADRVHGGEAPPLQQAAREGAIETLSSVVASEQGTRFFGKRNANVLARPTRALPDSDAHRWLAVDELLDLTAVDHLVNTDLRSVLVSAPWPLLVGRTPFTRRRDELGRWLTESAQHEGDPAAVRAAVSRAAAAVVPGRTLPLDELPGWSRTDAGIAPQGGGVFAVRQIAVRVAGREVPHWDQPIVDSAGDGLVELWLRADGPVARLGFRLAAEPGLAHGVELTGSRVVAPGDPLPEPTPAPVLARVAQSDEGGRFYRDVSEYRLLLVEPTMGEGDPAVLWLSLGEVMTLLAEGRWFTNEARSALALLLPWL